MLECLIDAMDNFNRDEINKLANANPMKFFSCFTVRKLGKRRIKSWYKDVRIYNECTSDISEVMVLIEKALECCIDRFKTCIII